MWGEQHTPIIAGLCDMGVAMSIFLVDHNCLLTGVISCVVGEIVQGAGRGA